MPNKTKMAEELLLRLVSESNVSAFERSILPEGIEKRLAKVDWGKRDVLVGPLRSKKQFETVLNENYYYLPKKYLSEEKQNVRYISLYQSVKEYGKDAGILYYGEVIRSEVRRRKDINNLPERTDPNEWYYYFEVDGWKKLNKKIEFEKGYGHNKERLTNYFLLNNCYRALELFKIKTAEEFRLVYELRRFHEIQVEDNQRNLFIKYNDYISVYCDGNYIKVFSHGETIVSIQIKDFLKFPGLVIGEVLEVIKRS